MKTNLTHLAILIDRSGSMSPIRKDMEGAIETLLRDQERLPGEMKVTIAQFDTDYEILANSKDVREIRNVQLIPRGSTALYYSLTRLIDELGEKLSRTPEHERPSKVIFAVVTDGGENSSPREYTARVVLDKIKHQTDKYNWNFIYLGANQDAFAEADKIGIQMAVNYQATPAGIRGMSKNLSSYVASTRASETNDATNPDDDAGYTKIVGIGSSTTTNKT